RACAIWSLPRPELFFLTSLRSFSSSPLGTLQTAFALHSPAASVVNNKEQKNFRRMLRILQRPTAQLFVRALTEILFKREPRV
ncbi:hypothetical protein, partial [uncultured Rikenella sp.]|uniref:hypothetical protein n=1 Tax=uncultured Rikenella sp. TaxID=368003 RepID=UPI0025E870A1